MGDIVHQSQITITRERGPTRKAIIKGFDEPVYYGVHGGIKGFYRIEPEQEHAATLDHLVGAVGGWMMGTFATVLAHSKIATPGERYRADVSGDIENVDGVLKITRINVHYTLKLAPEQREAAEAAFASYLPYCPAAQSVKAAIELNHTLEMQDK